MSKHKKRKHKRVADPYDDYMQKRHAYWAACAKKGELTEEQAHTCDELEMFVSAVIVFSDISPQDTEMFERAWSFRDVFLRPCRTAKRIVRSAHRGYVLICPVYGGTDLSPMNIVKTVFQMKL